MTTVRPRPTLSKEATLLYTDATSKKIMTLPRYARINRVTVHTAATATNATFSLGTASDDNAYVDALSVATAASAQATILDHSETTVPTDLYGMIGGSPSSGGPFRIVVEYTYLRTVYPGG